MVILLLFLLQFTARLPFYLSDPQITSLESGFERLKYGIIMSSSFFILAILFVLFDIELVLLFPGVLNHFGFSFGEFIFWGVLLSVILITLIIE
jgi:NADH:ubiquinone oxidoreductase subunit 3 (subunit A)